MFVEKDTTKRLREAAQLLVHYTPDAAFDMNRSQHFENSLSYYDFAVTTKSFEINKYKGSLPADRILQVPQGFDKQIHRPSVPFNEKESAIVFVGLYEPSRRRRFALF